MLPLLSSAAFQYSLLGFCILFIATTHILNVFCKQNYAKILFYIAIPMHLVLFFCLGLIGVTFEVVLLTFLGLMCVYLLPRYVLYRTEARENERAGKTKMPAGKDAS